MKLLKSGLTVRGDSAYCPLALSLDSYWNCLTNCNHCYLRHLNHTWGDDLRPLDIKKFRKDLINGLKNKNPKSFLAHCLHNKKTIRWGNKTDPFQHAERVHKIAPQVFKTLIDMHWSFVIETMHTDVMLDYFSYIESANANGLITIMPVISPGFDKDWEILENKRTNPASQRLRHAEQLHRRGIPVGINGEPFIPGYHTVQDFEDMVRRIKATGINRYNTYNLHLNPFIAKKLHGIGLDIEKIWRMNQDANWKPILQKLLDIARKYDIILGCPDFVNTGKNWIEKANTCCGIDVSNPTTYNTHNWKARIQAGEEPAQVLLDTYDGSSDKAKGEDIVHGRKSDMYTFKDAGML